MRRQGWELPYHPLQVVAIAVFLALAFAFYVFFVPFVGKKVFEYSVIGLFSSARIAGADQFPVCADLSPRIPSGKKMTFWADGVSGVRDWADWNVLSLWGTVFIMKMYRRRRFFWGPLPIYGHLHLYINETSSYKTLPKRRAYTVNGDRQTLQPDVPY